MQKTFFINFIQHPVKIMDFNRKPILSLRPDNSGFHAVVDREYTTAQEGWFGKIMLKEMRVNVILENAARDIRPFPAPQPGIAYIVPASCAGILRRQGRTDVFCPGPLARDATDSTVGCVGLAVPVEDEIYS